MTEPFWGPGERMANARGEEPEGIRVTDRRRIDPVTGEVREGATPPAPPVPEDPIDAEAARLVESEVTAVEAKVAELTDDLRRVHAEYANYRKRVERDREAVREMAVASVLTELLPVLDDIDRAREHGELEGGFRTVAESFEAKLTRLGLERYGTAGEEFDPVVHEALTSEAGDVAGPTVKQVYQAGYRYAGRVLRPARVAVVDAG